MGRKSGKNWEKNSIFGNEKKSIFENGCCGSSPMNFCLQLILFKDTIDYYGYENIKSVYR